MPGTGPSEGVLVVYTGGTIGSLPKDPRDPLSPLVPARLEEVMARLPGYFADTSRMLISDHWIRLGTYSWPEPLDSSNVAMDDWKAMAELIRARYDEYEGFVILHGTDTLAYTASVLAFMLENLAKPVVLTGSQLPIGRARSDAVQNLVTAVQIAAARSLGRTVVPEVCVFFRDELYRGCRTTKLSASSFNAFHSPNCEPLARAGEHIAVRPPDVPAAERPHRLRVVTDLEPHIAAIDIFPGMSAELLQHMLAVEDLKGVVLRTFGTGNAPTRPDFLDAIGSAIARGKLIVDVTQCHAGEVELGLYDSSAGLLARGVVSGLDMTTEAAIAKMSVVLGRERDLGVAADLMQLNLKGEQRQSIFHLHFGGGRVAAGGACALPVRRPMTEAERHYDPRLLDRAVLRILNLTGPGAPGTRLRLRAFLDDPQAGPATSTERNPRFLGLVDKE
ncbi:MAG TPA: asparaginase domain-containing protein, partial [Candidatus Saccharimonadales bacterium]|nr:asparaginase domain-containing protein [Candidatus Saccharimonadales bacterium]